MPLGLLLSLVIGGIAGIAVLLHLLGWSRQARLADRQALLAAWQDYDPDTPAEPLVLAPDGRAGLVRTAAGVGIVWAFGADFVARLLDFNRLRVTETARGLRLQTGDATAPRITLRLPPEERAAWRAALGQPPAPETAPQMPDQTAKGSQT